MARSRYAAGVAFLGTVMRDLQLPGRSVVHGRLGAAATSSPLATLAAIDALQAGGSAADAAVAACAVQCVVEPMSTGIGGDCFALLWSSREKRAIGLNGSGRAPMGLTAEWLLAQGHKTIGTDSVHSVTVPGAVAAWDRLLADHDGVPEQHAELRASEAEHHCPLACHRQSGGRVLRAEGDGGDARRRGDGH